MYLPGDEVRMRLTFRYEANIVAVEVVYAAQEEPSYTLTLSGNPEPVPGSATTGEWKQSTVHVSRVVDVSHRGQYYTVRRVVFNTFSGYAFIDDTEREHWPLLILRDDRRIPEIIGMELQPEPELEPEPEP